MQIKNIQIQNFRGIRELTLELNPKLNVFIGINGSGKSSILDAIAMTFSRSPVFSDGNPLPVAAKDIQQGAEAISVKMSCSALDSDSEYVVSMRYSESHQASDTISGAEERDGHNGIQLQRQKILDNADLTISFPIVVYYPTNRAFLDIPERIRGFRPIANQLDALEGALHNALDFRSFIGRLRESSHACDENAEQDTFSYWYCSQQTAVQDALASIVAGFSSLRVEQKPFNIVIDKNGRSLGLSQLSDGEKCVIALAGDLAQRLAIANPDIGNPLTGDGVVLIDEIDLHLHPQWQRMILPKLTETFPNCQFIVSTHSPQVLGEIRSENVFILIDGENGVEQRKPSYEIFGQTSDVLLKDIMDTSERDNNVQDNVDKILLAIERNNIDEARQEWHKLKKTAADIPEFPLINLRLGRITKNETNL
jgi:predicted ATP-binding protein involved in virulence